MSLITRTDVTAVKFHKNWILAGLGSFLNVFEKESTELVQRIKLLNGQKIHGIVASKCGGKILVFGGKQFNMITELEGKFHSPFEPVMCDDWLQSGLWIDDDKIAVLTAHNVVQKWDHRTQVLVSTHLSSNNSILYSGLLLPLKDNVVVFTGTVFSDVIVHLCGHDKTLHRLKGHRGVIFSIACEPKKATIVTTSDDRSVRIWGMNSDDKHSYETKEYWENLTIECKHEVYKHTARVMRCLITDNFIISAGEDAALCFLNYDGTLSKKIDVHQTASIWSIDSDETLLVSGGGDSAIVLHPLSVASENGKKYTFDAENNPKSIQFTARKNLVILNEKAELVYYDIEAQFSMKHQLSHVSTFKVLSLSSCKQLIAVIDLYGKLNIFIENCKDAACIRNVIDINLSIGRVNSMHWAGNRHLVCGNDHGVITVLAAQSVGVDIIAELELPSNRHRALTAAAIDTKRNIIVIGDKNGNVHCYSTHQCKPVRTFKKVHGKYGPTSINIRKNEIVTTGRGGTVAYFSLSDNISKSIYLRCVDLEFSWPEKFLDKNETLICGFHERQFVVYNIKTNMKIVEIPCGGGHRCWDAVRHFDKLKGNFEEIIKIVFLKNSMIYVYTFEMSKIVPKMVVNGSQAKNINCLQTWVFKEDPTIDFIFTGGEDTTLRLSSLDSKLYFEDKITLKYLSNLRTLKIYRITDDQVLVLSGGGRAQLGINIYTFEKVNDKVTVSSRELGDFMVKGTDDERRRQRTIDFNPETRIMDLDTVLIDKNKYIIFAGCSDSYLRVFEYIYDDTFLSEPEIQPLLEIQHHSTCILKTKCIPIFEENILVTCTARGYMTFWAMKYTDEISIKPFYEMQPFSCGINALDYKIIYENDCVSTILICSAGDDTVMALDLIQIFDDKSTGKTANVCKSLKMKGLHCSQITGLLILENLLVSASIDQRITICRFEVQQNEIEYSFVKQLFSDISDIQGVSCLEVNKEEEFMKLCVFGRGMEVLKVDLSKE